MTSGKGQEAIIMVDEIGKIISVNDAFTEITGYDPYDIIGKNPEFLKSSKHNANFYRSMMYEVIHHGYWHGYIWLRNKDGITHKDSIVITTIEGSSGKKYYIGIFQDSSKCTEQEITDAISDKNNQDYLKKLTYFHLQKAMEEDQFEVLLQPVMNIDNGEIVGLEALLRWNHPAIGSISPNIFIPIAEKTGLINLIGEKVLRTSFSHYQKLKQEGLNNLKLMVNISVKQLEQNGFSKFVSSLINEYRFEAKNLEFEITESIFLKPTKKILKCVNQLQKLGIQLSLDDFGSGYSAFNYLKKWSFNTLKIDREFVRDINTNSTSALLVEMMITMSKNLGINVVVEGVETEEQLEFLREKQCYIVQGYYYSIPLSIDNVIKFINSRNYLKELR